jgi:hypothetical protein
MAAAKELQKTLLDSKGQADKEAKTAAALLRSTQLASAVMAKAKSDAQKVAQERFEYEAYMQHVTFMNGITSEHRIPSYPGWILPAAFASELAYSKPRLIMNIKLTDYYVRATDQGNVAMLKDQWATFSIWLRHLGFTVKLDHSAKQIGSSCGIVAARVATWLRESGDSFMDHDTHSAVLWTHIHPANTALANDINCKTPAFKHNPMHLWCTDVLSTGEVVVITDLFNGNQVSELLHRDEPRTERAEPGARRRPRGGQEASRFCRFPAFDQLL